jgi:hypothetical protein
MAACASTKKTAKFTNNPHVEYVGGSKVVVKYNAEKNKTIYAQTGIKFQSEIMVGSNKASGAHSFEIDCMGESAGKYSAPEKVNCTLTHNTAKKAWWRYPKDAPLIVEADGQQLVDYKCKVDFEVNSGNPEKCLQNELTKDDPSDAEFYESLFFDLPMDKFQALSKAKNAQVKIANANFTITETAIKSLSTFSQMLRED